MATQKRKIQTYIDDALGARLDEYAARLGLSTSLAVAKALESYFEPSVRTDSAVSPVDQYQIDIDQLYSELERTQNQSEAAFDLAEEVHKKLGAMAFVINDNARISQALFTALGVSVPPSENESCPLP